MVSFLKETNRTLDVLQPNLGVFPWGFHRWRAGNKKNGDPNCRQERAAKMTLRLTLDSVVAHGHGLLFCPRAAAH